MEFMKWFAVVDNLEARVGIGGQTSLVSLAQGVVD